MSIPMAHAIPPLPERPADAHKGTFGKVIVVGGSATMIGAPALTATAALRTGCGLARIATLPAVLPHCLTIEPSATGIALPDERDGRAFEQFVAQLDDKCVLAVGPGMGVGVPQQERLYQIVRQQCKVVVDADGLNNLAGIVNGVRSARCPRVLTPHPGEFHQLASVMDIRLDPTDPQQRPEAARQLAEACHAAVVLKGHNTVVADGQQMYINSTGNPALATAGSGDILTGMIASLIAQHMDGYEAAVLGVYLHGLAADIWAQQYGPVGLTARDLAGLIPQAMQQHRDAGSPPAPAVQTTVRPAVPTPLTSTD